MKFKKKWGKALQDVESSSKLGKEGLQEVE